VVPDDEKNRKTPDIYDVVVIGAGMAGVAAAAAVKHANMSVVILEARQYVGGRVHSVPFAGTTIELGANWIHGTRGAQLKNTKQPNPVADAAVKIGLNTIWVPGSCANVSGYGLWEQASSVSKRRRLSEYRHATSTQRCLKRIGAKLDDNNDISVAAGLKKCEWSNRDKLDKSVAWELSSANDILNTSRLSLRWMAPDPTYTRLGPDDHFVMDQKSRGYAAVIDYIAGGKKETASVKFGCAVTSVAHSSEGAAVTCEEGRVFLARRVLSTLPLGVMQRNHAEIFKNPPLPPKLIASLADIEMGNFTKIFASWPDPFWRSRGSQWLIAEDRGPREFHDLSTYKGRKSSYVLFTYVVGHDAIEWEAMSDDTAARVISERLSKSFALDVGLPKSFLMTRHGLDPFMRGAYSTNPVGVQSATLEQFAVPLPNPTDSGASLVYFAGEHTCPAFQGYLHGALWSGRRAAKQVIGDLQGTVEAAGYNGECDFHWTR